MQGVHLFEYLNTIQRAPRQTPVVIDWQNIESELMARYATQTGNPAKKVVAFRTAQLLRQTERQMLAGNYVHTVCSERERNALLAVAPHANVHVIGNGVDTNFFTLEAKAAQATERSQKNLLFVGSMDYHANIDAAIWFVREVWPALAQKFPALDFTIAGRQPTAAVRALATERVHVTGTVPDVRALYAEAFAVVVPLRVGGGTRLKILEAMAAGVPVISTSLGAEGLSVEPNRHLIIANTENEFSQAVAGLLTDRGLRLSLAENARKLVVDEYDWAALGQRLSDIYAALQ